MKLISCHIENFGVLSNKDYTFDKGINSYCKENGTGKTTLATFIRSMFYGLDSKINKDFPDRKHYYPFVGGNVNFGGNIVFETKGKIYKIERNFDIKSDSKDTLDVRDSKGNKIILDKEPGEYFFEIDLNSFIRTSFVSANDLKIESTDSINKKLGGFVNDIDETIINKKLSTAIKNLESTRKNSEGIVEKYNIEINKIEQKIKENELIEINLPNKYKKYEAIKEELKKLNEKKDLSKNQEVLKAQYEAFDKKKMDICNHETLKKNINEKYPCGLPSENDLKELKNLNTIEKKMHIKKESYALSDKEVQILNTLVTKYNDYPFDKEEISCLRKCISNRNQALLKSEISTFSEEDNKELKKLSELFVNGLPLDKTIDEYDQRVLNWMSEETHLNKENTFIPTNILNIKNTFSCGKPSNDDLELIEKKVREYDANLKKIESYSESLFIKNTEISTKHNGLGIFLTVLGGILLTFGIVMFFIMLLVGAISFAIGVILLLIGLIIMFRKTPNVTHMTIDTKVQEKLTDLKANNSVLAEELRAFFANYRLSSDNFISNLDNLKNDITTINEYEEQERENKIKFFEFMKNHEEEKKSIFNFYDKFECGEEIDKVSSCLKNKILRFNTLLKAKQLFDENENNKSIIINGSSDEIRNIFSSHNIIVPEGINENLICEIENDANIYNDLKQKKQRYGETLKEIELNDDKIITILKKYDLIKINDFDEQYNELVYDKKEYERLSNLIISSRKDLEDYKKEYNLLDDKPIFTDIDDDEAIEEKINRVNIDLTSCDNEIKEDEDIISHIDDLKADVAKIKTKQRTSQQKLENLKLLQSYFNEAEQKLKDKYIGPMENSFIKYANKINDKLTINAKLNYDFNLKYDISGKEREYKHLSEGQKTCLSLCMRLAMIENMYKDEKLFMILDDPFINLDAKNVVNSLDVLKELSKEIQILYFCCHDSRNIK